MWRPLGDHGSCPAPHRLLPCLLLMLLFLGGGLARAPAPVLLSQKEAHGPITAVHAYRGGPSMWISGHDAVEDQLQVWVGRPSHFDLRFTLNDTTHNRPSSAAAILAIDSCTQGLIATAAYDGTISIWRWTEEESQLQLVHSISGAAGAHRLPAQGVQLSADCRFAVSVGFDGTRLWDVSPAALTFLKHLPDLPAVTAVAHQSSLCFYVGGPKGLAVLRHDLGEWHVAYDEPQVEGITSLSTSRGGNFLFAGTEEGRVVVWDTSGVEVQQQQPAAVEMAEVVGVWASHSGNTLVTSSIDRVVRIWRVLHSGALWLQYELDDADVRAMQLPVDVVRGAAMPMAGDREVLLGCWSRLVALSLRQTPPPQSQPSADEEDDASLTELFDIRYPQLFRMMRQFFHLLVTIADLLT